MSSIVKIGNEYKLEGADSELLHQIGKPVTFALVKATAARLFKYLGLPPIPIHLREELSEMHSFAYYKTTEQYIVIQKWGLYANVVKHEIIHYMHHHVLGIKFHERTANNVWEHMLSADIEERHTRQQTTLPWKELKKWCEDNKIK